MQKRTSTPSNGFPAGEPGALLLLPLTPPISGAKVGVELGAVLVVVDVDVVASVQLEPLQPLFLLQRPVEDVCAADIGAAPSAVKVKASNAKGLYMTVRAEIVRKFLSREVVSPSFIPAR